MHIYVTYFTTFPREHNLITNIVYPNETTYHSNTTSIIKRRMYFTPYKTFFNDPNINPYNGQLSVLYLVWSPFYPLIKKIHAVQRVERHV